MSGVTGDFAGLDALIYGFQDVEHHFIRRLSEALATRSLELVTEVEHPAGIDPDFASWRPNKRDSHPPLTLTGALRSNWRMFFGPASFGLQNDTVYAAIHNYGGWSGRDYRSYMPMRRMVPVDWNNPWGLQFEDVSDDLLRSMLPPSE